MAQMSYSLSQRSISNLRRVHPDLVAVVERAIQITEQDFIVIEGVRTQERQDELWAQGRTKPGPIVTWTKDASTHAIGKDGYGRAVDICPFPVDWNDISKFDAIYVAMMSAADEFGVRLRYGGDWDMDGNLRERGESDSPHFELA
jgi:peptidoglycan L-alanyl-D-glutamate endopeptidase CwlK